jgi:hypothetical protein
MRPQWAEALVLRGSICLELASIDTRAESRARHAKRAVQFIQNGLSLNPHLELRWRSSANAAKALVDGTARP